MKYLSSQRGQSLFEVVVALAISALIITAIVGLVTNSIRNSTYSRNESQASLYAQELTEWLRGQRDLNTNTLLDNVSTEPPHGGSMYWCFPALGWTTPSRRTAGTSDGVPDCSADTDEISDTIFLRYATFSITHPESGDGLGRPLTVIEVNVTVTWTDSQGDHKVINSTSLSDLRQR